ncbi:hypothetical protein HY285_03285 [Candidatus Peregrinibacteria bacterium]|nr:hypothetical protein [Candidatus Peregrinibacteria bacterium]MBI3816540.1 hypothetical protein [Candidatus Peregrinibacteria bacterium]
MNPKQFLQWGGAILLLLAVLGFLNVRFGDALWFDSAENYAHGVLGVVALVLAPLPLGDLKRWVVVLVGLVALYFGVAGFMVASNSAPNWYGITNLEFLDNIVHLAVGVWALAAAFMSNPATA